MKSADALRAFAKREEMSWKDALFIMAEQGMTQSEAAEEIGISRTALQQYCARRNVRPPWQGVRSPSVREHRRRMCQENRSGGNRYAKRYTVQGHTGTLPELAQHFGINISTVYTRLRRGMGIEAALTGRIWTRDEIVAAGARSPARKRNSKWWNTNANIAQTDARL